MYLFFKQPFRRKRLDLPCFIRKQSKKYPEDPVKMKFASQHVDKAVGWIILVRVWAIFGKMNKMI